MRDFSARARYNSVGGFFITWAQWEHRNWFSSSSWRCAVRPKELPKLGRTIGKAMTEFRRAQTELKSTFDREMKNLERETGIQELTATTFQADSYDYDIPITILRLRIILDPYRTHHYDRRRIRN